MKISEKIRQALENDLIEGRLDNKELFQNIFHNSDENDAQQAWQMYDAIIKNGLLDKYTIILALIFMDLGLTGHAKKLRLKYEREILPKKSFFGIAPEGVFDMESEVVRAELLIRETPPKWGDACEILNRLWKNGRKEPKIIRLYAQALHGMGKYEESINVLENETSNWAYNQIALNHLEAGRPGISCGYLRKPSNMNEGDLFYKIGICERGLSDKNNWKIYAKELEEMSHDVRGIKAEYRSVIRFPVLYHFYKAAGYWEDALINLRSAICMAETSEERKAEILYEYGNLVIELSLDRESFRLMRPDDLPVQAKTLLRKILDDMDYVRTKQLSDSRALLPFLNRLNRGWMLLGNEERADNVKRSIEQLSNEKRMIAPDLKWLATHWFPLDEIRAMENYNSIYKEAEIKVGEEKNGNAYDNRRVAILAKALTGRLTEDDIHDMRNISNASGTFSDIMYLMEYCVAIGDRRGALESYERIQSKYGFNWDSFRILFGIQDFSPRDADEFSKALDKNQIYKAIASAEKTIEGEPWNVPALRCLSGLMLLTGNSERAESFAARANAIDGKKIKPGSHPEVGRIWAAASYRLSTGVRIGIIHNIVCQKYRNDKKGGKNIEIMGNIQQDFGETINYAYKAATLFIENNEWCKLRPAYKEYREYIYKIIMPLEKYPMGGKSAGITLTMLFLSSMLELPLPQDIAMTGEINIEGDNVLVKIIADEAYKARGMAEKGLRYLILPKDNEHYLPLDYDFEKDKILYVNDIAEMFTLKDSNGKRIFEC